MAADDLKAQDGSSDGRESAADRAGAAAVSAIWRRHRAEILGQVGAVEDAVRDGVAGRSDNGGRERGGRAAHKLAGSCGTFGFPVAGEIAGRVEDALCGSCGPSADQYLALVGLAHALRRALESGSPAL
ncbi:MAG: hypothetical protein QOH12_3718 [Solirubrobacteraceae bacterium]|jgi:hypothetical protein|nr:hypothetical protein [Solirubrobacteraceae bacterium]